MKAKIFIYHHSVNLVLFKNLAEIIGKYDKNVKIILIRVNHKYFSDFDFSPYEKYFDKIIDFEFISYNKNIFKGLGKVLKFQRKLKEVISDLSNFEEIDLFLAPSAWLPINILLYNLSREKNVKNINKISFFDPQSSGTKTDKLKTLFCAFYSLFFNCYNVKVISTLKGKFVNFEYSQEVPGTVIRIASPTADLAFKENILPYPFSFRDSSNQKKDIVIVFGDTSLFQFYSEFFPDKKTFNEKMALFFKEVEKKYSDCQLYYKPHPGDQGKIMDGVDIGKYKLFDNSTDIQVLFDEMNNRIKAVYSFCSVSIMFGSFFGIPSYTFYRYLFNQTGINKFDDLFNQDNLKSKFLFHISNLNEIGSVDDLKRPEPSDSANLDNIYRKLLNV